MKKLLLNFFAILCTFSPVAAYAQQATDMHIPTLSEKMKANNVFSTLEIAANIGTTGLGLELATPVTKWAKLRAGVDWMPNFTVPMYFSMDNYVNGQIGDKFGKILSLMYDISGMSIDKEIKMESKPTMTTFRLLVDIYPFQQNKHWHFTAGIFIGGKAVGKSLNAMTEMPSLLALNMYDRIYEGVTNEDFVDRVSDEPVFGSLSLDREVAMQIQDKMLEYGKLGVHIGDYVDAEGNEVPYMMLPDKDGTVSAKALVNRVRPYVGFGYGGALSSDGKWQASFDAGVQFWGGVPKVTTHDGTVLNDLKNLRGKVGTYMNLMKLLPVYPTIDFRISYTF